ncbi:hypothetical protein [Streptomyces sp. NPDC058545]|uniref:hypothetical protein n=1 Tax=Streptomyces sp. NPDC058545 TaxID=3346544 RepID=UPI003667C7D2
MNVKSRVRLGAVVGAAVLSVGATAGSAVADAPSPRVLAGVGSDTTQDVMNAIAEVVDGGATIASYNATGSATIKTRVTGCDDVIRPDGSSAGINALNSDVDALHGCLDFARSSRGPVDTTTQDLTWIPFAKDAVSIAVREDSALNNNLDLTTAQLHDIYTCDLTTLNGVSLTPLIPQANSGTRTFFLGKIGVTEAQLGTCVGTMQEHNGVELDSAGDIAPYSIAQYIAQVTQVANDRHGATVLGKVDGSEPFTTEGKLNTSFVYSRDVYNVVPTKKVSDGDATITATFVGVSSKVCTATDAGQSVIEKFGFGQISTCGATTLKGER